MGQTQYRAPFSVGEVVRDAFNKGMSSPLTKPIMQGDLLSLELVKEIYTKSRQGDEAYGGGEGLKWSRRILRQESLLKNLQAGTAELPLWLDLQLGPNIFAAITDLDLQKVSSMMMEEEVASCCIPFGKQTAVFFPASDLSLADRDKEDPFAVTFDKAEESVFVDENRDRLKAIIKAAGKATSRFTSFRVGNPEVLSCSDCFGEFYLLKTQEALQTTPFIKVDKKLGLLFGWGVICTKNGEAYFDTQGDHAPDDSMLEASAEYMLGDRVMSDAHIKDDTGETINKGTMVFAWPMTKEVAEAFGFPTTTTGLMVGVKPNDPEILTKFENGEYTGFSIGGYRIPEHTEEVD